MIHSLRNTFYLLINDNVDKSAIISHFEQLSNPLDWDSFVNTAQKEKLLPLLYYACKQKSIEHLMPASVLASMQSAYINNMGRTFFLKKSLSEVLKAFNDQHIKIMLLKGGAHLVEPLYPDINTRVMSDIDIMVLPEDIPRVKQVFQNIGYAFFPDPWGETNKMNFVKGQFNYELHTRPFSDRKLLMMPSDAVWINARERYLCESTVTVYLPAMEDMLYHCIFHELIQHGRLFDLQPSTLYEVDQMLKAYQDKINLVAFFERAKHFRLEAHLSFFFYEFEKMFHTLLPSKFRKLMCDTVEQLTPFYQQILQLPPSLKKAGQRYLNFNFLYDSKHKNRNHFVHYISPSLNSPREEILSYYRLSPKFKQISPIIRMIHITNVLFLHIVVKCLCIGKNLRNNQPAR